MTSPHTLSRAPIQQGKGQVASRALPQEYPSVKGYIVQLAELALRAKLSEVGQYITRASSQEQKQHVCRHEAQC